LEVKEWNKFDTHDRVHGQVCNNRYAGPVVFLSE
jgi:hypothetical protein